MQRVFLYFSALFTEKRSDHIGPVFYYSIYMVRRLVIVLIALFMFEYPLFQILLLKLLSLAFLCYLLHFRPYDELQNQRLQVFNELVVYFCCYISLILLLIPSEDSLKAFFLGWFMIVAVVFNIVFNMVLVFREQLLTAKMQFLRKN